MLEFHGMKLLWLSGSVVMNHYFWVVGPGGVVFLGCQMEGSKIHLLSIDGMIGKGQICQNDPKCCIGTLSRHKISRMSREVWRCHA